MKQKVLMVCLGNICRSPLAEGILKAKTEQDQFYIDSAGTAGYHVGSQPDPRSIAVAQKHQIDISGQRCRKFKKEDFYDFDHIFVMDRENYRDVVALAPSASHKEKVRLILEGSGSPYSEVPDPYYGARDGFEEVYQLLDQACDIIVRKLKEN